MSDFGQELYETRTNLFSCENLIEYFWRRCYKNSYPFKPENSSDIQTQVESEDFVEGKIFFDRYSFEFPKDLKNSGIKKTGEYNVDVCHFQTFNMQKAVVSQGKLVLVYKPDRRYYSLFLLDELNDTKRLSLLMKVKQKNTLFGSFETEMATYY